MEQRKGRQIVFFPLPLQGHINPMLQLANILYTKGFSITIIHTHFNSPKPSNYPHFTFHSIPDALSESDALNSDLMAVLYHLNTNLVKPFHDCLARLLSEDHKDPIACLITDAIWQFTQAVANKHNVPRIVLRTSSICSFLAFAALDLLRERGYMPLKDSELETPVPELPPLRVQDLPEIKTSDLEHFYGLLANVIKETKASAGLIWNSYEELEQDALATSRQVFRIPNFVIGPLHMYFPAASSSLLSQDKSCMSWLDKQAPNSVLYVSFGSIAAVSETEFLEIAWGLANSNQPFLWVVRPGLVRGSEWLEPLPSGFMEMLGGRGHIVKWAPQQEVLTHPATGGFWTHCGWNSTLESLCEGVPMICQPSFGDQRVNARYISHVWRVGVHLEYKLDRVEIGRAIKRLMVEKEGEEMRNRIRVLREKTNSLLNQTGSSSQSLEKLVTYILSF
ncbi:hypothetical protein SLE2022_108250 [Rubroshorea leprosula]